MPSVQRWNSPEALLSVLMDVNHHTLVALLSHVSHILVFYFVFLCINIIHCIEHVIVHGLHLEGSRNDLYIRTNSK